jgi:hypothetical protein
MNGFVRWYANGHPLYNAKYFVTWNLGRWHTNGQTCSPFKWLTQLACQGVEQWAV